MTATIGYLHAARSPFTVGRGLDQDPPAGPIAEHGREALGLGADPLLDQLAPLSRRRHRRPARGHNREKKMNDCVRGLRGHASATLHSLMVGLIEKPLLRAVIRETNGNQVRAAQLLGITAIRLGKSSRSTG